MGQFSMEKPSLTGSVLSGNQQFTWHGSDVNAVLGFAFASAGLDCAILDVGVTVLDTQPDIVRAIMKQIAASTLDIEFVAESVKNLQSAKFDEMVPEQLLRSLWARSHHDVAERATSVVRAMVADFPT